MELWQGEPEKLTGGRMRIPVKLINTGNRAVLGARVIAEQTKWLLWGDDNDMILFPGEQKMMDCYFIPAPELPFENPDGTDVEKEPILLVEYL